MRKALITVALTAIALLGTAGSATAVQPAPSTFVAVLDAANEVPHCGPATNAARGVAVFHVTDQAAGAVEWKLVANNLPGRIVAAHIHIAPAGVAGPILQPLSPVGQGNGVIGTGTFRNHALLVAMQANPSRYYVNVHSSVCPSGVIRGQLGLHGP